MDEDNIPTLDADSANVTSIFYLIVIFTALAVLAFVAFEIYQHYIGAAQVTASLYPKYYPLY